MTLHSLLDVSDEVRGALHEKKAVVALESTVIAHGLPAPMNLTAALAVERAVREEGAVPATVGVFEGRPTVGLSERQIEVLASAREVVKASRRDLSYAVAGRRHASTTVAATMFLAHKVGIRLFATGGIGGAHRDTGQPWDISADLFELGQTPVAVVCAGAKSVLDIPRTLEILETHSVPVVGFRTSEFPAFYLASSGLPVSARLESEAEIASLLRAHWDLGEAGVVIAQPLGRDMALDAEEFEQAVEEVESAAIRRGVRGKELTPFLLSGLADATKGKSLQANLALLVANARLAARIAVAFLSAG